MRTIFVLLFVVLSAQAQWTPYGLGLIQKPNAISARAYLGVTVFTNGTGITFTVLPSGIVQIVNTGAGSGSVTTFSAGTLSPIFTTSVANATTTPALSFSLTSQSANKVLAGPTSGGAAGPTFRSLVAGDLPSLSYVTSVDLAVPNIFSLSGNPITSSGTITISLANQSANTFFTGPASGGATLPTFRTVGLGEMSDVTITSPAGGDVLAYSGTEWTNGPSSGGGGSTSLPGLLQRPVYAAQSGTLSAPLWPDSTRYQFDEEFDTFLGTSSGQFGSYLWTGFAGGVNSALTIPTNPAPYFGVIQMQVGPSTSSNFFYLSPYAGATGINVPFSNLGGMTGWLFHAIFMIPGTNVTYSTRLGLVDRTYRANGFSYPSNGVWVRFDTGYDTNKFSFEGRSNSVSDLQWTGEIANSNTWYKISIISTNAGFAVCYINNSSPVIVSNIPTTNMTLFAFVAATNNGASQNNLLWLDRVSFMASGLNR